MEIRGVAKDLNVARIALMGVADEPGMAFRVFSALARKNIDVDIIIQSQGRDGTNDISFSVTKESLQPALDLMEEIKDVVKAKEIIYDENVAKISIVGAGMTSKPGVAAKMFEALYEKSINIEMITTSEIKVSVLIRAEDADRALVAVHDKFIGA